MDGWMDGLIETLWVLNLPCCYDTVSRANKPPRCAFSQMEFSGKDCFPQMQMDFSAPKSSSHLFSGTLTVQTQIHFLSKYRLIQTGGQLIKNHARVLNKHKI